MFSTFRAGNVGGGRLEALPELFEVVFQCGSHFEPVSGLEEGIVDTKRGDYLRDQSGRTQSCREVSFFSGVKGGG